MDSFFIRIFIPLTILLNFNSCSVHSNYNDSDKYEIKQRKKQSLDMFKKTHEVRRKCSKGKNKSNGIFRKFYYN